MGRAGVDGSSGFRGSVEDSVTLEVWIETVVSTAIGLAVPIGFILHANELWPFNSKAPEYQDPSRWRWLKQAFWYAVQAGFVGWLWYVNDQSPEPVQPMAIIMLGWAMGLAFTWTATKLLALTSRLWHRLRYRNVLAPLIEDGDPVLVPEDDRLFIDLSGGVPRREIRGRHL